MRMLVLCAVMSCLFHSATQSEAADQFQAERKTLDGFLKAFAAADTKGMLKFYTPDVIVLSGSTLLDPKYGALGDPKNPKKNVTVKKERLAKAYEIAIQKLGGKDDWKKRGKGLLKEDIKFIRVTDKEVKFLKPKLKEIKIGDVIAIVIPKGDSVTFILRKEKNGNWLIFAEHWD